MLKTLTVIFSFNTPARTHRCYNELLLNNPDWNRLVVLDNSAADKVCRTPDTVWLGEENRGHGGMIDWVLENDRFDAAEFDLVGMINNDTYDYQPHFMAQLVSHAYPATGILSPAIKPGGSVWPTMLKCGEGIRPTNFIETIAPWYGRRMIPLLRELRPMEWFGHLDRAVSILARRHSLVNTVIDDLAITHEAGKGRDELGTREDYCNRWRETVRAWYDAHPQIAGLHDVWPDEINARDWAIEETRKSIHEGSVDSGLAD